MKRSKRALAALLAVLMAASSAPFAMASDTLPYLGESARGENQPYQHGYRAEDLLDWSRKPTPGVICSVRRFLCRTATLPWLQPRPTLT